MTMMIDTAYGGLRENRRQLFKQKRWRWVRQSRRVTMEDCVLARQTNKRYSVWCRRHRLGDEKQEYSQRQQDCHAYNNDTSDALRYRQNVHSAHPGAAEGKEKCGVKHTPMAIAGTWAYSWGLGGAPSRGPGGRAPGWGWGGRQCEAP